MRNANRLEVSDIARPHVCEVDLQKDGEMQVWVAEQSCDGDPRRRYLVLANTVTCLNELADVARDSVAVGIRRGRVGDPRLEQRSDRAASRYEWAVPV